jgi:hypothetical protein
MCSTGILFRLWVVLVALISITSCGGGGGAQPAPVTPINISALLTGAQETPAVVTAAVGVGTVSVDPVTKRISGIVVTTGIIASAAHIHDGAAGVAGPVIIPLNGGPTIWTVPDDAVLSDDQFARLNSGGLYFNVHTAANPDGEIRGQINQQLRVASLSGANEVPPVTTNATGVGVLALNPANGAVIGFIRTTGITGVAAHVHDGAVGVNGPVAIPLEGGPELWTVPAGATMTAEQIARFIAGALYFNVHSAAFPDGEIRGQIVGSNFTVRNAILNGSQETPPVATGATGTGIAVVNSITREVFADVRSFGLVGNAAHIHEGVVGVAGPVRVNLDQTAPGSGIWTVRPSDAVLTPQLLTQFGAGNLYFNVHTTAFPAGEIRGQINLVPANNVFTLGGGAEIAPPSPPAPVPVFPSSGVSFSTHVQQIFNLYCIACHASARIADFFPLVAGVSYGNLVNVPTASVFLPPGIRVIPGNAADSALFQRVSGVGLADQNLRMPLGGPFLDTLNPSAIGAIQGWINEGAANN